MDRGRQQIRPPLRARQIGVLEDSGRELDIMRVEGSFDAEEAARGLHEGRLVIGATQKFECHAARLVAGGPLVWIFLKIVPGLEGNNSNTSRIVPWVLPAALFRSSRFISRKLPSLLTCRT